MKTFRLFLVSLFLSAIFVGAAVAQQPVDAKIALVNTDSFYLQTGGIKKIANAYTALNLEFKTSFTELENMAKRFEALQKEAEGFKNSNTPVKPETIQAKVDEAEKLQRDYKFKQEESKALYEKREAIVLQPIVQDIGNALGVFAKQKGFTLIFDSGKLSESRVLLYLTDATEVTTEFIAFYNARPAGTATK